MAGLRRTPRQLWTQFTAWALTHPLTAGITLATAMCLPTLGSGWLLDDWIHRAALLDRLPIEHPTWLSLFTFADGVPEHVMARTQLGYGWWTLPDLKLQFLRPVSAALHEFDERVLGSHAVLHHLHSLLWQAAGIATAALLFRRLLSVRTAALATLLYAIDESHWTASSWIANRNAWVSMVPAMLGFWAWLRAEDEDWLPGKVAAPLLFGIGLCGGETALGVAAMWVTVALSRSKPGHHLRTVLHLAPLSVVLALWAFYYKSRGYGASASGAYIDPGAEPLRFLAAAIHRVPSLAGALWASLPVELAVASTVARWLFALLGAAITWLIIRALRRATLDPRDAAAWPPLAIGGLLALIPPAATWPSQRTLLAVSLVSAALVAMLLDALGQQVRAGAAAWGVRWGRGFLMFNHAFYSPFMALLTSLGALWVGAAVDKIVASPLMAQLGDKRVVMVTAPVPVFTVYLPSLLASSNLPLPRQFTALATSDAHIAVTRTGPNAVRVEALAAPLLSTQPEQLIMDPTRMPHAGTTVHVPHLDVRVEKTDPVGVTQAEFVFDAPLEEMTFLQWRDGQFVQVPPPSPVRTVVGGPAGTPGT